MNYAILHKANFERVVEIPNMDYMPMLIDYTLENGLIMALYVPEMKEFRFLNAMKDVPYFVITNDKDYSFNGLRFFYLEGPLVWDLKNYNYIDIIEKEL